MKHLLLLFMICTLIITGCSDFEGDPIPNPPKSPMNINVMNPESGPEKYLVIHIEWDEVSNTAQYGIFRKRAELPDEYYTLIGVHVLPDFGDRTAVINTDYTYAVKAYNIGGASDLSESSASIQLPEMQGNQIGFKSLPDIIINGTSYLNQPNSLALHNNNLFIVDEQNNRIVRVNIETNNQEWLGVDNTNYLPGWHQMSENSSGSSINGGFNSPKDIFVDNYGVMYITDLNNNRVQKIMPDGRFEGWLGWNGRFTGWHFEGTGSPSTADGCLFFPFSVTLDKQGYIYIADNINRIQKFNLDTGKFVEVVAKDSGTNPGAFSSIGLIYTVGNVLYAADTGNNRIQKLEDNTWYVLQGFIPGWDSSNTDSMGGNSDGYFSSPESVTADKNGYVYVSDSGNCRIQMFKPDGSLLGWLGTTTTAINGWFPEETDFFAQNVMCMLDSPSIAVMDNKNNNLYICCNTNPGRIAVFSREIIN